MRGATTRFPFDGEGTPAQQTHVVEDGTLRSLLFDLSYARKLNQSRFYRKLPPRKLRGPSGERCDKPFDRTRNLRPRRADRGCRVRTASHGTHGVAHGQPCQRGFFGRGSRIQNREREARHPVKGIAIAGNLVELFGSVQEVAMIFVFREPGCAFAAG